MKLDSKVEQALQAINFVERYEALSQEFSRNRTPKEKVLDYYDGDFLMDIVNSLGYEVKFNKKEYFFSIKEEKIGQYEFGLKFALRYGMVELIWDLDDSDKNVLLGTNLFSIIRLMTSPDNKVMSPIISDYVDFRDVMKTAFEVYEDFKQAFLKIAKES
ncbi:hypothetical protein SGODD07_01571 [Streptococcus gordonii]|uniref:Uncharacterized protein n=1 Tax=Streptococcus gordonii TaxID=1302 RepID=A0A139N2L0_STRGN|nr:hypothetical protein SGODD07_01571 [Streptococcus gordonii]